MKLLSLTLILFLASCTSFTDTMDQLAGHGQLSESYQQFNDSTTYEVSPTWLYRGDHHKGAGSIKLGARWNTKIKEYVALVASYDSTVHGGGYLSISSIEVSIDEQVSEFTSAVYKQPIRLDTWLRLQHILSALYKQPIRLDTI